MDVRGVAIASTQALNAKVERQNESLKQKNAELEERLALIEALVTQFLSQNAQN